MNLRALLKLLFLIITFIISSIYMITTYDSIICHLLLIPITLLIITLNLKPQKRKPGKIYYFCLIITSLINISLIIYYIYYFIHGYLHWNSLEIYPDLYYLILVWISLIATIFDIKKDTNSLNDILTIISCTIITLVFYRYYIDPHFLHNLVKLDGTMVGNTSYHYIHQHYNLFSIMLLVLLIQNKINNYQRKTI